GDKMPFYPLMRFTPEQMAGASKQYFSSPLAPAAASLSPAFPVSFSLLPFLRYVPAERDQGFCGNCWAWAGTGIMEIAHNVQNGISDRLSVQFINSCSPFNGCCEGGSLPNLADFYIIRGLAIPWSNLG